jgi:Family of unknown function (DUF5947)
MPFAIDSSTFDDRIEALTSALESLPDARARMMSRELVALVLELHKHGLQEFINAVDHNESAKGRLVGNPIVQSLLALHGLSFSPPSPLIQLSRPAASTPFPAASTPDHGGACAGCGAKLTDEHRHIIDLDSRLISCSCRACWLLAGSADRPSERAVPTRYHREASASVSDAHWEMLRIPVDVAFFMTNSRAGRTFAFYPSPTGPTESALPLEAWHQVLSANPWLQGMASDVEALLVRRDATSASCECFVVPIDSCYELVGRIRLAWTGLTGGSAVQRVVDAFFADLLAKCGGPAVTQAHPQQ